MTKVNNMSEARDFFLSNSTGSCVCVGRNGEVKVCKTYPEAVAFFKIKNFKSDKML